MPLGSITSATATYFISIPLLFPVPQPLQEYAADDIFDTPALKSAETLMGADGILSGGFVFVPIPQNVALQANSPSNQVLEQWWLSSQVARDVFVANAIVTIPSIGRKWTLSRGFLTGFHPIPDAKRTLMPRRYEITWNNVQPAAV